LLLRRLQLTRGGSECARVDLVGVVTRAQPALLRACVDSHVACARRAGRDVRIVVLDDSDEDDLRTRDVVAACASEGMPVAWAGADERRALVDGLVARGAPRDAAARAATRRSAGGIATGAARNALLLATAGRVVLFSDDDIQCVADAAPDDGPPTLCDRPDPMELELVSREEDLPRGLHDVDVLGAYERALGSAAGARVLCATAGLRGSSGMGLPFARVLCDGASRERLLGAPDYDAVVTRGLVRRAPRRLTHVAGPFGLAAHLAIDNRVPLPPFATEGRNQDGVFFALRCRLFPRAVTALLPLSVFHSPASPVPRDEIAAGAARVRINDFLMHAILRVPVQSRGATEAERARVLGEHLADFAASEGFARAFVDWYRESRRAWLARADEALASERAAPGAWHADVGAIRDTLAVAIAGARAETLPVDDARRSLGDLASLLVAWPALRRAAERSDEG
jgi:hypothetical protein